MLNSKSHPKFILQDLQSIRFPISNLFCTYQMWQDSEHYRRRQESTAPWKIRRKSEEGSQQLSCTFGSSTKASPAIGKIPPCQSHLEGMDNSLHIGHYEIQEGLCSCRQSQCFQVYACKLESTSSLWKAPRKSHYQQLDSQSCLKWWKYIKRDPDPLWCSCKNISF